MTKRKISPLDLYRLGEFYMVELQDFVFRPASPAMLQRINDEIANIRMKKMRQYPGSNWEIDFHAILNSDSITVTIVPVEGTFELI